MTATGNIYHAKKPGDNSSDGNSASGRTGSVNFPNRSSAMTNLRTSAGVWQDSTRGTGTSGTAWEQFRANASQTWNGNLQTGSHGVQNYTPVAVGQYVEDPTPSNGVDNSVNTGRALIEPSNYPTVGDASYDQKMEIERQKYANDAGIYIKVVPSATPAYSDITVTSRSRSDPAKNKVITVPSGTDFIRYTKYATTTASGVTTVTGGMYDQHRAVGLDLVELDMAKLRDAVAEMQLPVGSRNAAKAFTDLETTDWTGIVYVEIAGGPTTRVVDDPVDSTLKAGSTIAATNARHTTTSVRVINGVGQVPSYSGNGSPGLTIATDAPIYIKGHFNADGTASTSGGVNPATDIETGELPAAIISDAITVLSPSFNDATSRQTANPTASHVEVSAAFLTGLAPTNKDGNGRTSGGAHNIVRFLENWGSRNTWLRGSLVSLFESRVFTTAHGTSSYYSPPIVIGDSTIFSGKALILPEPRGCCPTAGSILPI